MSVPSPQYPSYAPLPVAEVYQRLDSLFALFSEFSASFGVGDALYRKEALFDIIERVEKRRVYFRIFHDITMSELNETALYCFWVLKLAPFVDRQNIDSHINAKFALFMLMGAIKRIRYRQHLPAVTNRLYTKNLYYAFLYRDLSKEAIMALGESLLA